MTVRMKRITDAQRYQKEPIKAGGASLQGLIVDEPPVLQASELAEGLGLRSHNSIHFAGAERICSRTTSDFRSLPSATNSRMLLTP